VGIIRIGKVWLDPTVTHVEFQLWIAAASSSASPPERLCFPKTSSIADWEGRWRS
jgi:hypothetical protein